MNYKSYWKNTTKNFYKCDKSDDSMLQKFINDNEFNRFTTEIHVKDLRRLFETGVINLSHSEYETPPYIDHISIYKNSKTKTVCLVYQPYRLDSDAIVSWFAQRGLKAKIYDQNRSWYWPGCTYFVCVTLPNICVKVGD